MRQLQSRHDDDGGGGEGPNVDDNAPASDSNKEDGAPTRNDSSPESAAPPQGRRETEHDERGQRSRNYGQSKTRRRHYYSTW